MKKSKFLTFLLSCLPGLGHFYLGLMKRGVAMMASFLGIIGVVTALVQVTYFDGFLVFLAVLPVIWFYNMFDALSLCEQLKQNIEVEDIVPFTDMTESFTTGEKNRFLAILFGLVPGAGHMYLGWQEKGLQLMISFFLSIYLIDWLRLSFLLFMLPVIWFYSFFDVLQVVSGKIEKPFVSGKNSFPRLLEKQRWVGIGLIFLGVLIIFDKLLVPYLDDQIVNMIKTGIVSVLLIGGGIRLVMGNKISLPEDNHYEEFIEELMNDEENIDENEGSNERCDSGK